MSSPMHARKAKLKNHLVAMKGRLTLHVTLRRLLLLLAALAAASLLLLTLRTLSTASTHFRTTTTNSSPSIHVGEHHHCTKLPPSVADALVYYATANSTPQQTAAEIAVTARVLARRAPCNLLVFGLGLDSPLWAALNHGGRTAFLEEDATWIAAIRDSHPDLKSHHVDYDTKLADADALLELRDSPDCTHIPFKAKQHAPTSPLPSACKLALKGLPAAFYEKEWDVIMVDAPTGRVPEAPGRMGAIYTAGMAARERRAGAGETDVMVHDVDRAVEDTFSKAFLCEGYLKEEVGRLRHFAIPSHKEKQGMPFCP